MITVDTDIQELIAIHPELLPYLMSAGLCGLNCGAPEAGTVAFIAKQRGFTNKQLEEILAQLNKLISPPTAKQKLIDRRDEFQAPRKWSPKSCG